METIIVGTRECPVKTVLSLFYTTDTTPQHIRELNPILRRNCMTFVEGLNVSVDTEHYRKSMLLDKLTPDEVIRDVLDIWVGQKGSHARLSQLLEVIEVHCGAVAVGESIRRHFKQSYRCDPRPKPERCADPPRPAICRDPPKESKCCCVCF